MMFVVTATVCCFVYFYNSTVKEVKKKNIYIGQCDFPGNSEFISQSSDFSQKCEI